MTRPIHTPQNLTATERLSPRRRGVSTIPERDAKTLFNFNGDNGDLNTLPFYKILIGFFLFCIFLGGCSGSSSSKSSTNDNSSAEEKCKVENGVAKLKDGECKVTACDGGL